jgi:hypothetical protein
LPRDKVIARVAESWSVLELPIVVVLVVLACILPMAGIVRGVTLLQAGLSKASSRIVLGEIVIGLILGAMGTHLLGDAMGADLRKRMNLWASLFGLLVLLSLFYIWQFFYSPRARRLRGKAEPRQLQRDDREDRDLEAYEERLKKEKDRGRREGGVRKPKGMTNVERIGWVRNMEGEDREDVWRVETDFDEKDEVEGGDGTGD